MGKPWAGHCGCPSAEQIVQTVHSPSPILSPVHCLCPCISFWLGKIAHRASEQTVQKRAGYLPPFPGELAFLFRLQAVKGLEEFMSGSWINCFKPQGRRWRFFFLNLQMVGKMFPSKLCIPPFSVFLFFFELPNIWHWLHTEVSCNTNDVFSWCE